MKKHHVVNVENLQTISQQHTLAATLFETATAETLASGDRDWAGNVAKLAAESPATIAGDSTYRVLDQLGAGGMGVVYRARQNSLQRDVAVKQMHHWLALNDELQKAFWAEAVITGTLEHPNIVPVYDMTSGKDDNAMVLKLVTGSTWATLLHPADTNDRQLAEQFTLRRHLEILIAVCNPVAFAHSHSIIHRDLKPSNVMIGEFGEILVVDWGLALSIAEDAQPVVNRGLPHRNEVTGHGGTPAYMAPEMARGDGHSLDERTDIYLLGAILYEILAGRPPHDSTTVDRTMNAARNGDYKPLPAQIPDELAQICYRALMPVAKDRYPTVLAFQQALRDYISHQDSIRISSRSEKELSVYRMESIEQLNDEQRNGFYAKLMQLIAGFDQALLLWPENHQAEVGRQDARLFLGRLALHSGDFGVAQSVLADVESDEATTLRETVENARQEQRAARHKMVVLRRMAFAAVLLVLTLAGGSLFLFRGMEQVGQALGRDVYAEVKQDCRETLLSYVSSTAKLIEKEREQVSLAAAAFAQILAQEINSSNATDPTPPALLFSKDIGTALPDGYQPVTGKAALEKYARLINGKLVPQPVTFDAFSYAAVPQVGATAEGLALMHRTSRSLSGVQMLQAQTGEKIIRFFAGFETSKIYLQYPGAGGLSPDYDPTTRPWYRLAKTERKLIHTFPYTDAGTGQVVLSTVVPIKDPAGQLLGVAGVDTRLTDRFDLQPLPSEWAADAVVEVGWTEIDNTGKKFIQIVARQDYADRGIFDHEEFDVALDRKEPPDQATLAWMEERIKAQKSGIIEFAYNGQDVFWAIAPIIGSQNSKLYLLVSIPKQVLAARAADVKNRITRYTNDQLWDMGKVMLICFFVVVLAIALLTRKMPV